MNTAPIPLNPLNQPNTPKKPFPKRLDDATRVAIIRDYHDKYSMAQIAKKYNVCHMTVSKIIHGKGHSRSLKQPVEKIAQTALIQELEKIGVNAQYIANKIKELVDNSDKAISRDGIREYAKVTGSYAADKVETEDKTPFNMETYTLSLPANPRQAGQVSAQ